MTEHYVDPSRALFDAFKSLPRNTRIEMLNLVRFRGKAAYPDDHPLADKDLSGAEAYRHYGEDSAAIFRRVGGMMVYRGAFEAVLIGPESEQWDAIFVAAYPDASAFLEMVTDEDYKKAVVHRQPAVETSRLIRLAPRKIGDAGFA